MSLCSGGGHYSRDMEWKVVEAFGSEIGVGAKGLLRLDNERKWLTSLDKRCQQDKMKTWVRKWK